MRKSKEKEIKTFYFKDEMNACIVQEHGVDSKDARNRLARHHPVLASYGTCLSYIPSSWQKFPVR